MLSEQAVLAYKTKLESEKRRLLKEIEGLSGTLDFGSDIDHGDEEADEAEEFQNELGVAASLKTRVNEIDAALGRIASDAYGACESCEKEISEEVLRVAPESKLCAACKHREAD